VDLSINKQLIDLKAKSLSKLIEQHLEKMILDGELAPGERINESSLSQRLKISRAPIREACRQLAQYGLVETRVGRGAYICQVSLDEAIELYELRGILDAYAAEKVSQKADAAIAENLGGLVEEMRSLAKGDHQRDYLIANLNFHRRIIELSGNGSLALMYDGVVNKLALFRQMTLSTADRRPRSLMQHEQIFEAIVGNNPRLAGELARSHVEDAKKVLIESRTA